MSVVDQWVPAMGFGVIGNVGLLHRSNLWQLGHPNRQLELFGGLAVSHGTSKQRRSDTTTLMIRHVFDEVAYTGRVRFKGQIDGDHATATLTWMSSFVFHRLFLDFEESLQSKQILHAMGRVQMWVYCSNEALQSRSGSAEPIEFVIASLTAFRVLVCRGNWSLETFILGGRTIWATTMTCQYTTMSATSSWALSARFVKIGVTAVELSAL
jgi:hypothetical protein